MDPAARLSSFKRVKEHYDARDRQGMMKGVLPMGNTSYGFWGTTDMNDAYDLFSRIRLERFNFCDLGCGDGRVVMVASLFTDATGVEGDEDLARSATEAKDALGLERARIVCGDYYKENFSAYDILFMFPDTRYDALMVGKLLQEFTGYLLVYNRVYAPPGIKAGKTYWIGQMPIASYPINVLEENLELDS